MTGAGKIGKKRGFVWALWGLSTLAVALALWGTIDSEDSSRELFLPGETTHGHYQIELACEACHTEPFGSQEDLQSACVSCHAEELERANDSHPEAKFTDPRNADRIEVLDARYCVTCHAEHQPETTGSMGLSLPGDYCYHCHQEVAEERPSHEGLAFDSCADSGCHNFHDNKALYEDYLVRHGREGLLLEQPFRLFGDAGKKCESPSRQMLAEATEVASCEECHSREVTGWKSGRHGMRHLVGLDAMTVGEARLPMKPQSSHASLGCGSCHAQERSQTWSALEACESCHSDEHTTSYRESQHFEVLQLERAGKVARGSGVTCATCHMPRLEDEDGNEFVQHNQNENLRPNEKMIRGACSQCHGLPFAIDALADIDLVASNFSGQPQNHVPSVDWALARE